ncbi:DUF4345 domain-containing protein [Litorimonas sp. RW-G-Af-16]|uniref:DUF4345 domain-containing protein n=1 Tax=Litorimonas sp. RW-G-Af-16 TaxID=3241168 RepID=UPI00390C79B6
MRSAFKIVLMVLSLIPLTFAIIGLLGGAAGANGGVETSAALDNQFRYLSAYYLSLFFLIWYVLADIDTRGTVLRLLIVAIFLGGLARLYSYLNVGTPEPQQMAGMALELGSPILALWHRIITHNPKYSEAV